MITSLVKKNLKKIALKRLCLTLLTKKKVLTLLKVF